MIDVLCSKRNIVKYYIVTDKFEYKLAWQTHWNDE